MVRMLSVVGDELGLVIDQSVLDLLKIDRTTPLEIKTDGTSLIVTPAQPDRRERIRNLARNLMDEHQDTFRQLAQ